MHFVILGSGRVGAMVADLLDKRGHSVAIIDKDSSSFRLLPPTFSGRKLKGMGFDRDTLIKADINNAYAFAAVSDNDNTNILAARIARETFGVQRVVARIYNPRHAEVYERMGIPTVGTVRRTSAMILQQILPEDSEVVFSDPDFGVVMLRCQPVVDWVGVSERHLEEATGARLAYVRRNGTALVSTDSPITIQENDELFLTVAEDAKDRVRHILSHRPTIED